MSKTLQAPRGMNDILPTDTADWELLESTLKTITQDYGYREIRTPLLEQTALFCRSVGTVTDIVEKEMYTFTDRDKIQLSLRPEGTASCVRAGIQRGLLHNQIQRLWYTGPFFRHERPQKGRYRQFYQWGVEAFGIASPDIDAELIALSHRYWQALNLQDLVHLEISSLGSEASRQTYKKDLVAYFSAHKNHLDDDSLKRLETNPLRILDSKNTLMNDLLDNAPNILDSLDEESADHFKRVCHHLKSAGIPYHINPRIVRGLDYYNRTVFEWVSDALGAQGTVCAGGRFDSLVEQISGKSTPAIGFALGIDRLVLLLQEQQRLPTPKGASDIYFITQDAGAKNRIALSETLRNALPHLRITTHCGEGSIKNQMKKADKSGANFAIIVGEDECQNNRFTLKPLKNNGEQASLTLDELKEHFSK
jgi:histidyl-tRNA synthetase